MRFRCNNIWDVWDNWRDRVNEAKGEWHDYFAIFPVKVGQNEYRWLETVSARRIYVNNYDNGHYAWRYLAKDKVDDK